jgi:hypothetical protein
LVDEPPALHTIGSRQPESIAGQRFENPPDWIMRWYAFCIDICPAD